MGSISNMGLKICHDTTDTITDTYSKPSQPLEAKCIKYKWFYLIISFPSCLWWILLALNIIWNRTEGEFLLCPRHLHNPQPSVLTTVARFHLIFLCRHTHSYPLLLNFLSVIQSPSKWLAFKSERWCWKHYSDFAF